MIKQPNELMFSILKELQTEETKIEKPQKKKCTCEKHGEYIATVLDGVVSACPKCAEIRRAEQLAEEEKIREQEKQYFENALMIDRCKKSNISPEFYFSKLEDYKPKTKAQEEAKKSAQKMIETNTGKLILLGSNGAGKTMLASIIAKALNGHIYTMYEIATMIRQSYTSKAEKSELEIVRELVELPFLAIDEVGRIANSEAVQNWFSFILDKRHSRKLPTVIIGNLHFKKDCEEGGCPKCFENYFDKDILSRFHEDTSVIVIKAPDERQGKNTLKFITD